jgi:hypothetical protein
MFASARFYTYENEKTVSGTPMDVVNRTSKKGRLPLFGAKLCLSLLFALLASAVFCAVDWIVFLKNFELPELSASIKSIAQYSAAPDISIMAYTVLSELLGTVGCLMLSLLCFSSAAIIKRSFITFASLLAALLVPHFARTNAGNAFAFIDLTLLQNVDQLLRIDGNISASVLAVILFGTFGALSVFLAVLSSHRIKKGV